MGTSTQAPVASASAVLRTLSAFLLSVALSSPLVGCFSPPAVTLRDPSRTVASGEYDDILDRWTREREIVDIRGGFESRLDVTATYFSKEFRRGYVARYSAEGSSTPADRERMMSASLSAGESEHEFFVALAAQYNRWGELDRNTSTWRVRLVDDAGVEHAPLRIERHRVVTGLDRAMFYYWTPWRLVYHLHFPMETENHTPIIRPEARHFVLRFAGPYGTADLRWDLRRD